MKYDPKIHNRRSIRLKGYDYSRSGAYFITICIHQRRWRLGQVCEGVMVPSIDGGIVAQIWHRIPQHFPNAYLDEFVVMPNHIHGILWLGADRGMADRDTVDRGMADRDTVDIPAGAKHSAVQSSVIPKIKLPNASPQPHHGTTTPPYGTTTPPYGTTTPHGTKSGSVCAIVQNFKSISTRKINQINQTPGSRIWQRDYYERIIWDDVALDRVRAYIRNNPRSWAKDKLQRPSFN
jgi:putative transposase